MSAFVIKGLKKESQKLFGILLMTALRDWLVPCSRGAQGGAYPHACEAIEPSYGFIDKFRSEWLAELLQILAFERATKFVGCRSRLKHIVLVKEHDPANCQLG